MTIEALSAEKVMEEVSSLQVLYELKRVIRWADTRSEESYTESVAEHVYGMFICAQYFLPLENPDRTWDRAKIFDLITIHDFDEIETGDQLGYLKTANTIASEQQILERVIARAPQHLQAYYRDLNLEYAAQTTIESRFVKAVDKFEPTIHICHPAMKKTLHRNQTTSEKNMRIKLPYVQDFPYLKHFTIVIQQELERKGVFKVG